MKVILKRVVAYFIDIILVSMIAAFISTNQYINPDYKKYEKAYNEYNEKNSEYVTFYSNLEEIYEDKKITENEYDELLQTDNEYNKFLSSYYEDKKITDKEYEKIINDIESDYSNREINYSYKLLKYSVITTIISLMCILLYFVVIQYYFNGKTLGKFLMKLKVVSNNSKNLTILNYFIRSLVVNEVFISLLNIIFLLILSKNNFIIYNQIIYIITYILEMTILFTLVFDKNNRGLHDRISNTKVIEDKKE